MIVAVRANRRHQFIWPHAPDGRHLFGGAGPFGFHARHENEIARQRNPKAQEDGLRAIRRDGNFYPRQGHRIFFRIAAHYPLQIRAFGAQLQ